MTAPVNWRLSAACRDTDPDLFFPVATVVSEAADRQAAAALAVCRPCPVSRECLGFAVASRADGIWGGTTESDRLAGRQSRTRGAA